MYYELNLVNLIEKINVYDKIGIGEWIRKHFWNVETITDTVILRSNITKLCGSLILFWMGIEKLY